MVNLFFLMSPFFLFFGFVFMLLSLLFSSLSLSFFLNWTFFFFSFRISFPIYLDFVSCLFMSMVLIISGSIIFYSEFYMSEEIYKSRFFFLMFLFVLSMIFLILSPSLFCMLLGWDGLGLISYCLVIYYQNYKSYSSGMITALTNRVGDAFVLGSISLFFSFGSWNYMNFFFLHDFYLCLFFVIAAMTKSAQVPFSAWLPAAMAAPTPVSSLVHSSTLVTAGVYILIRFDHFLIPQLKFFLMCVSLMTMIMAGVSGLLEFDLKKIIALSTLSQLGFMMATISLGFSDLAFFHLITHAGFKALLFMCAGYFIHSFFDNQDIRGFGLLNHGYSFSLCMFNTANLSLSGFPFLSGFFSKDLILELMLKSSLGFLFFILFIFGTFLTVAYSFRLFFFLTFYKVMYYSGGRSDSLDMGIQHSMYLLFFFSICLGYLGSNLFFLPYNFICLPLIMKLMISFVCLSSFMFSVYLSSYIKVFNSSFVVFMSQMWFLHYLKTDFLKGILNLSYLFSKSLIGYVETFMGLSVVSSIFNVSILFSRSLKIYFFMFMFLFFMFMVFFSLILI